MKFTIQIIVALIFLSLNVYPQITLESYIINLPKQELSEEEKSGVILMREEEKLANDVYLALFDKWKSKIFENIASSEKTHTDWVGILLNKYGLTDPMKANRGEFNNLQLKELYDALVLKGSESLQNAYYVGCTIEDLDIKDLLELMSKTDNIDIKVVYQNLTLGSRNHMRSFSKNYSALGLIYKEQFITKEYFENILKVTSEKGPVDENGNPLNLTDVNENNSYQIKDNLAIPSIFSATTTISFSAKNNTNYNLTIIDINGVIIRNASLPISENGEYQIIWDGTGLGNKQISNGIYFISIRSNNEIIQGKVILLR